MILDFYQNLPSTIDPVVFSIGAFPIYWYSLMWICGIGVSFTLLLWRSKVNEVILTKEQCEDLMAWSIFGALIGGRLGYVLFYNIGYYSENPLQIFLPYDFALDVWVGISGMSFHGGLIGVVIAILIFCHRRGLMPMRVLDDITPIVPLGYCFGRLGNFLGGELYGRPVSHMWGMDFGDGVLRHPSQLYEAFGEGVMLFVLLWLLRNSIKYQFLLPGVYLCGYGLVRFMIEYFREPDAHLGLFFSSVSMGQVLSLMMMIAGAAWILFVRIRLQKGL